MVGVLCVVFVLFLFLKLHVLYQKQHITCTHGPHRNPKGSPDSSCVQCACYMKDIQIDSVTVVLREPLQALGGP